jgi:hypothetical protein
MFRPIWTSSGVKTYLLGKLMLFVVAAVTCVRVLETTTTATTKSSSFPSRYILTHDDGHIGRTML